MLRAICYSPLTAGCKLVGYVMHCRLVDLRVSLLALDSDAILLSNPFELLNAPPLSRYAMVVRCAYCVLSASIPGGALD